MPYLKRMKRQPDVNTIQIYKRTAIFAMLPLLNLFITFFVKPRDWNCDKGYVGPGPDIPGKNLTMCAGGMNLYIDKKVFGENRIPRDPNCMEIFGCVMFDEDGILGTLNFIFSVYLGSVVGVQYLRYRRVYNKMITNLAFQFVVGGTFTILFGAIPVLVLIPINGALWSVTYVTMSNCLTIGLLFLLGSFHINRWYMGWPFRAVGKNGIFVLLFSQIMSNRFPFAFHHNGNLFDSMLSCMMNITVWTVIAVALHKYRFYIKY